MKFELNKKRTISNDQKGDEDFEMIGDKVTNIEVVAAARSKRGRKRGPQRKQQTAGEAAKSKKLRSDLNPTKKEPSEAILNIVDTCDDKSVRQTDKEI